MTVKLTCSGCLVGFTDADAHRHHYQSEWHRYNLNRRVKGHPPVLEQIYLDLVSAQAGATAVAGPTTSVQKEADRQLTEEEYEKMLQQRLSDHRLDASTDCLFCPCKSTDFQANLQHMQTRHSLYLPDRDYLHDAPGLVQYLADKIAVGFCLQCVDGRRPFAGTEAVRRHMADTGHSRIRFDEEGSAELCEFYSWPGEDDEEWEDADQVDQDADVTVSRDKVLVAPDETEMVLPSGAVLGNRAYWKYYKQHLRSGESTTKLQSASAALVLARQRAYDGIVQQTEHADVRTQRADVTDSKQHDLHLGVKQNKFQPHYRLQIR